MQMNAHSRVTGCVIISQSPADSHSFTSLSRKRCIDVLASTWNDQNRQNGVRVAKLQSSQDVFSFLLDQEKL